MKATTASMLRYLAEKIEVDNRACDGARLIGFKMN